MRRTRAAAVSGRDANPTAALFIEQCSGCHGTDLAGGRAPSLFNEQWLASTTDERIANAIRHGVPNTAMAPFKSLSDEQIWQLTQSCERGAASCERAPRSSSLWTARW